MHVADLLTPIQLAQLAATPSQLKKMEDVTKIMTVITPVDYGAFFDIVSPAIEVNIYIAGTLFLLSNTHSAG